MTVSGSFVVTLAPLILAANLASAAPPISPEITLDYGFRYRDWRVLGSNGCAIRSGPGGLFFFGAAGQVFAYRRGFDGAEIDLNRRDLTPTSYSWPPTAFGVSEFDGTGWKLAVAMDGALSVLDVDPDLHVGPDTLRLVQDSTEAIVEPQIVRIGDTFLLFWMTGPLPYTPSWTLKEIRFTRAMELLDPAPIVIADGLHDGGFAVAARDSSGILAWSDEAGGIHSLPLDEEGLPADNGHVIGGSTSWENIDIAACALGGRWFVAWSSRVLMGALLDAQGVALREHNYPGSAEYGLAVCAADSVALIAWREHVPNEAWNYGPIRAVRIDSTGASRDATAIDLGDDPYCCSTSDPRGVSCVRTGESFVVFWARDSVVFETGAPAPEHDGAAALSAGLGDENGGSKARWIGPDGHPLQSEPLLITQMFDPASIGVLHTSSGWEAFLDDNAGLDYLHVVPLDPDGLKAGETLRYSQIDTHCDCPACMVWAGSSSLRPWGEDAAVIYKESSSFDWEEYDILEECRDLIVDRIGPDGSRKARTVIPVGSAQLPRYLLLEPSYWDCAILPESLLAVAYAAGGTHDGSSVQLVKLSLARPGGLVVRTRSTPATLVSFDPTVAATGSRILAVWVERDSLGDRLLRTTLQPDAAGQVLSGTAIASGAERFASPYLIPSDGDFLCVYRSKSMQAPDSSLGWNVEAIRLDANGLRLGAPFAVCRLPGDQWSPKGVWDGREYLVAWTDLRDGSLWGNRIDHQGGVTDGDGFFISQNRRSVGLAADGQGRVAIAYGGNRLRFIVDDVSPVPVSGFVAESRETGVRLSWSAQGADFRGFVIRRSSEDDPESYIALNAGSPVPGEGPWEYLDGTVRPGCRYNYMLVALTRGGEERLFGPVSVAVEAQPLSLVLYPPHPNPFSREATVRFVLPKAEKVRVRVFDASGRLIRILADGPAGAGSNELAWDGRNLAGRPAPSGLYLVRLDAGEGVRTRRFVLVRE